MKILVVTNMYAESNPAHPAQGVFVTEQVEALRNIQGDVIDVFVIKGFAGRVAYLKSIPRVLALIKSISYDVVHYHFGMSACSAPLVRLLTGTKIIITFHGSDVMGTGWMRLASLFAARFAHACICVSDEIHEKVKNRSMNCVTIPCAVNETLFAEPAEACKVGGHRKTIVFPASPKRREKDYPLFREVIEQLSNGLTFHVEERHIDGLSRREVSDLLTHADCLIMTSQREGSPQSVKEAMAVNLPVVSVDVGDVRNLLHGVSRSVVVEGRDARALAAAAAEVLRGTERSDGRMRLKQLGYFSLDVATKICRLYESISGVSSGDQRRSSSRDICH